jgi:MFS family permease
MLIIVRLLQGFGLGMIICLVPLYITEVAPARIRGRLSGLTVFSFGVGYVMYVEGSDFLHMLTLTSCPFISVGTMHATNLALSWRLPLALACVGPLALLAGLPFVPGLFDFPTPRYFC